MKKIAFFCIPAHGHHNPMLPVAAELIKRGNQVRFYSFGEFKDKIEATGAQFISCDKYLPELTAEEEAALKSVTISQMAIQDIRITINMNDFLEQEFKTFKPDVVYTDSACFWGKLNAWKFDVPMVVSTSTFAFNQLSSKYMKNSPKELSDMIFGLPKISKEMKTLEPYGYPKKGALELVQSDNNTDSVVYTSRKFQPFSESFSDHYAFVGPSVFSKEMPHKDKERPLVYISMGTVINDRPDFYNKCDYGLILQREPETENAKSQSLVDVYVQKVRFRHLGQLGRCVFGFDPQSNRFVGTNNDNITLRPYDRSDWTAPETSQQDIDWPKE